MLTLSEVWFDEVLHSQAQLPLLLPKSDFPINARIKQSRGNVEVWDALQVHTQPEVHEYYKNIGTISKLQILEQWRATVQYRVPTVLGWSVNVAVIWHFVLAACDLIHIFCKAKFDDNYAEHVGPYHAKFSHLGNPGTQDVCT
jgi:hypothetical protein